MVRLLLALALVTATAVAYAPLLDNDFVNYDDDLYITNSPEVHAGLTGESATWAFTTLHGANWFPLTRLSWMLDSELFGIDPVAFHVSSGVIHAAAAVVLFLALSAMTGAPWPSAFAAAVFALHPLHVESVAWASARKDVLSGLFFALALWAWAGFASSGGRARWAWYASALACLVLGLMAKQVLVALPFVLLLLDEWPLRRLRGPDGRTDASRVRRALLEKGPLLLVVAAACGVAVVAQRNWDTVQPLEALSLATRVENALLSVWHYVAQSFWPVGLSVFYPHPGASISTGAVWAAGGFTLAVTAAGLLLLRRFPPLAVGWLWFLVVLLPVIGLVQVGQAARADRYTYLPLVGLSLPIAWGLAAAARRGRAAAAVAVGLGVASLVALGTATHRQVQVWRDSSTLFRHALEVTTDNHVAHMNLGLALTRAGRLDDASRHLMAAVRLAPTSQMAHGLLGELRLRQERWREAAEHLRVALQGERDRARWSLGLGSALLALGEQDEALTHLKAAVEMRPGSAPMHAGLGLALARSGDHEGAARSFREALRLEPDDALVHGYLGEALEAQGDEQGALAHYERALELSPDLVAVRLRLADALARRGRVADALARVDAGVERDPDAAGLHALRARLLEAGGRSGEAAQAYRRALELGERSPALLNNFAWLLATSPDPSVAAPQEAVALAEEAAAARPGAEILDTLSVAYAAAGRRAEAADAARRALAAADERSQSGLAARLRQRLGELESGGS